MNIEPHLSMASPASLADVLEQRLEEVLQRWTHRVREGLSPGARTRSELRDHLQDYLQQLVAMLRQDRREEEELSPSARSVAREHGQQRLHLGFDLETLVREYGVLRECILDLVEDTGVKVFVDPKAVLFLLGTQMDFQTTKLASQFVFNNPNQTSACGCGESVAITPVKPELLPAG